MTTKKIEQVKELLEVINTSEEVGTCVEAEVNLAELLEVGDIPACDELLSEYEEYEMVSDHIALVSIREDIVFKTQKYIEGLSNE